MIYVTRDSSAAARRLRCVVGRSRRRWRLRAGVAMLAVTLLAPAAAAADLDDAALRGSFSNLFSSSNYSRWDGVNFGAHIGVANMNTDFSNSSQQIVAHILRTSTVQDEDRPSDWAVLGSTSTGGRSYGAFLGYNWQWDQLVLGLDGVYNRVSTFETSAGPTSLPRVVSTTDSTAHAITITAQSAIKLIDYGTFRLRAGYAFGQFLPYAIVGGAVGRFNYASSVTLKDVQTNSSGSSTYGPILESASKDGAITGGFVFGLGMDVALLPNVFLRGEWEFVGFAPINGIRPTLNTGRVALGLRF